MAKMAANNKNNLLCQNRWAGCLETLYVGFGGEMGR